MYNRRMKPPARARAETIAAKLTGERERLADLAHAAVDTLAALLNSQHDKIRLESSKAILDRAGLLPLADRASSRGAATLSEMPIAELRALADTLESELAARAKPVSPALSADMASNAAETLANTASLMA
jgi:hypothetical protein